MSKLIFTSRACVVACNDFVCIEEARSLHGCWTCRVRRKKCDELHPLCSNCTGLNLSCDGYGPRPAWLDGGVLEKSQAVKIKRIVKQTIKRRSRSLSGHVPFPEIATLPTALPTSSVSSEEDSPSESVVCSTTIGIDIPASWDPSYGHFLSGFNDEILGPDDTKFDFSTIFSTPIDESSISYRETAFLPTHIQTRDVSAPQNASFELRPISSPSTLEPISHLHLLPGPANTCLETRSTSLVGFETSIDDGALKTTQRSLDVSISAFSNNQVSNASHEKPSLAVNTCKTNELVSWNAPGDKPDACRSFCRNEAALLMHYLDQAFYTQFPFHNSSANGTGRGWLLTLLTGDETIYFATLAFSQYHRDSKFSRKRPSLSENFRPSERVDYYVFALKELQLRLGEAHTWSGSEGMLRSIKALACILQFVFLEVFSSNSSGDWSVHLQAATALLPSLVQARVRFSDPSLRDFEDQELKELSFLSPEDHFAIELLLGAFLWLDILAHVSTRAKLSSQFNHEVLLERGNIQLENLFGCKNWAMLLIFKVSKLDNWKRECEENRKLSVAELVRQGAKIEAALNQGLAGIASQNTSQMRTSPNFTPEDQCSAITEVFALAALTYLHVVVSGAHPDLPEINDSVARAIDALGALRDRKLLARVVWPTCVTGCMVSEDKQNTFRDLVAVECFAHGVLGTLPQAHEIIEHCWKEREAGAGNCEWFSAMKSIGLHLPLV